MPPQLGQGPDLLPKKLPLLGPSSKTKPDAKIVPQSSQIAGAGIGTV
jgi:hypothetical protein